MKLVGITGLLGSGKDTLGRFLRDEGSFRYNAVPQHTFFAEPLKEACLAAFGGKRENYFGTQEEKEQASEFWAKHLGPKYATYRKILQTVGTDVFRTHVHRDFWALNMQNKLEEYAKGKNNLVTVTDIRFDNEAKLVKSMGGLVVHVQNLNNKYKKAEHSSEDGILGELIDFNIVAGNLEELRESAISLLEYLYEGARHSTRLISLK